jgi:predicted SAM-dependent methyltransferase
MVSAIGRARRVWERVRNSYKVKKVKAAILVILYPAIWAHRRMGLPRKLRSRSPLWIHFGCGDISDSRFINVDARPLAHVDYVTKSPLMPAIPKQSAELIYACHVFEHISHFGDQTRALARWRSILKPGGQLLISVPDFDKIVGLYQRGEREFASLQPALMGGQEYPGNFHFSVFTTDHLRTVLESAGFTNIRHWRAEENDNWPKDWSWDDFISLNLRAENPASL